MTNKDMVPRPGPGPAPKDRNPPSGARGQQEADRKHPGARDPMMDPPDSPQVKPSQDRK
jgi:hypothetical protein